MKTCTSAILFVCLIYHASAVPVDYSDYQKTILHWTKDGFLCSHPAEQYGNYSSITWGFFKTNYHHFWIFDFDVSELPPFEHIAGVQLVLQPENSYRGTAGIKYNEILSDADWIQGTGTDFTVVPPDGEPSMLFAQNPDVPWKQGVGTLRTLMEYGAAPLISDSTHYQWPNCIFDLDKNVVRNFLEGNAHGIGIYGWNGAENGFDFWSWYRAGNHGASPQLWVFTDSTAASGIRKPHHTVLPAELQACPNPFNPHTRVQYTARTASHIRIDIINTEGKRIRTLVNRKHANGTYVQEWDGRTSGGQPAPGGIYLIRMEHNGVVRTQPVTLLR